MANKRTHKDKKHLARQMMTRKEISEGVTKFDSLAWRTRAAHRHTRETLRALGIRKND